MTCYVLVHYCKYLCTEKMIHVHGFIGRRGKGGEVGESEDGL